MNYQILNTELITDPLGRNYAAMSIAEAAADLNTAYRSRNRASMSASEIVNLIDETEWGVRTAEQKETVWNLIHMGAVNPFGVEATMFQNAMTGATTTLSALAAARVETISRAVELGLGAVDAGQVETARVHY